MKNYMFEKEIRLFGMKRSGNSGLNAYICKHFDSEKNQIVYLHNTHFTFVPKKWWSKSEMVYDYIERCGIENIKCLYNTIESFSIDEMARIINNPDSQYYKDGTILANRYGKGFLSRDVCNILLLRSPHNHLASLLRRGRGETRDGVFMPRGRSVGPTIKRFTELWVGYAKEILGETDIIPNKVVVLFDEWFQSFDYRESMSESLGLVHNDAGVNRMFGRVGSSFNGRKYMKRAQEMKVLDRWKYLIDPGRETWWTLDGCKEGLLHPEVVTYTKAIFDIDLEDIFL